MKVYLKNGMEKMRGIVLGAICCFSLFLMASPLHADSEEAWNCEETASYSIYEDISRTEGKQTSNAKILKWIDANTVGFESISLSRINPISETYFSQSSGSYLQINRTERPYLVVLMQPQVWMNKFGNLRVRFYRCTP